MRLHFSVSANRGGPIPLITYRRAKPWTERRLGNNGVRREKEIRRGNYIRILIGTLINSKELPFARIKSEYFQDDKGIGQIHVVFR